MTPYFTEIYGNASSVNSFGVEAKRALEASREEVAEFMNADPRELIFTASATEANNLVLKGHAMKKGGAISHLAVSTIEHESVLNTSRWLEKQGFRVEYLPVDRQGLLRMDVLEKELDGNLSLVSVVHGNNEIGTIQPIQKIARLCHEKGVLFHTDAVQSFGKLPIDVREMNIDFMTINAHKLYGPKGVGALYIRRGLEIAPLIHGGGHESGLRSGTENVPGIVGFAKAVELRKEEMTREAEMLCGLRGKLTAGALRIPDTHLNGHPTRRLPNNVNIRFAYVEGESVVLSLDSAGIAVSSGSACSSKSGEVSHVLQAIGLEPEEARGSVRFSLGKYNTDEDICNLLKTLPSTVKRLREISPLASQSKSSQIAKDRAGTKHA
jgi:cysteine desulfurase